MLLQETIGKEIRPENPAVQGQESACMVPILYARIDYWSMHCGSFGW